MTKLLLTEGFMSDKVIGQVDIHDNEIENLTKALSSGQFTFSSSFQHDTVSGKLTLLELSLIPIATLSTADFRLLNQKDSKKIFGVNSIFVDWILNNIEKKIREEVFRNRIKNLQIEFVDKANIEGSTKYRKDLIIDSIISLAIAATEYGITEEDIQKALEPVKSLEPKDCFSVRLVCICDLRDLEWGDLTKNISYESKEQMIQKILATGKLPNGEEVTITGHFNQTGGYCCPHYGNTCGFHPEYK